MARSKLKNKGFSLLEVIIMIAILSTGIVVILQALSFSARVTGLSCDMTNAVFLAQDLIQELEFKEKRQEISAEEKTGKKNKFVWNYAIINLEPDLKLYKLDLDVVWQRLNREERLDLNTYLKN